MGKLMGRLGLFLLYWTDGRTSSRASVAVRGKKLEESLPPPR